MIRTQVLLTPEIYQALKLQTEIEDLSLSAIVRKILGKVLIKKKKTGGEILMEMAKHSFSDPKIPTDLSTNDEYLYGKKAHYGPSRR